MEPQTHEILEALKEHGITYEYVEHPPVMTIDEFKQYEAYNKGLILKNLFLRDDTGKKTFLLSCKPDTKTDLRQLADSLGVKKVSFASADRLMKHMRLLPGAVSPLGLVFDTEHKVTMALDASLKDYQGLVGVHPGSNAATVFLEFSALLTLLNAIGVKPIFISI